MSSKAAAAIGIALAKGNAASPEVFTTVAEVRTLKWDNYKLDMVDVTNMDSPNFYKEYIPTLLDAGEITADVNYLESTTDTTHTGLQTDMNARTLRNWTMTFPKTGSQTNAAVWAFSGFITDLSKSFDHTKQQEGTVKVKITGKPVFTPGS